MWDVGLYRELYRAAGGKDRMRRYAGMRGLSAAELSDADLAKLHARKHAHYAKIVRAGQCPLRPGFERLICASRPRGLRLAISTTTSRVNIVEQLIDATLRPDGFAQFQVVIAGEDVAAKKPAPEAYLRVLEALALRPTRASCSWNSHNGLLSARAAALTTIVTPSLYTRHETFDGAAMVLPNLADFDLAASGFASGPASA